MTKLILILCTTLGLTVSAAAQSNHSHGHSVDFGSLEDGWLALETVSAQIHTAVETGNMAALHDLSGKLHSVADGLASHDDDVPQVNQLRFTSSINQVRSLSDRFHAAHESNDVAAAQRLVPQLNGMVQLLMMSAE
jgi:hypothetical protein